MQSAKPIIHDFLNGLRQLEDAALQRRCDQGLHPDCRFYTSPSCGSLQGADAIAERVFKPLRAALQHVRRRDEIFIAGSCRRAEALWLDRLCNALSLHFLCPFFGSRPSKRLAFLRAGELYRIKNSRITRARIILDLPDLMRRAGRDPFGGNSGWKPFSQVRRPMTGCCPTVITAPKAWTWSRQCWAICTSMTRQRVAPMDRQARAAIGLKTCCGTGPAVSDQITAEKGSSKIIVRRSWQHSRIVRAAITTAGSGTATTPPYQAGRR